MSGIRCFLCSRVALRHLSVGSHLAARCLSQCLGRQELAALKHHAACFQSLLGYSLCLPTLPFRPWREITFCNEQVRRIVILNTAPPDFAGEQRKAGSLFLKGDMNLLFFSNDMDVDPKCCFPGKLSKARTGAVKESILQQTGCLHYGRHDIFTSFFGMWVYCYVINVSSI